MTRIIGIAIILVGLGFFAFGALPLLIIVLALIEGKPVPWRSGANPGVLLGAGMSMIAYGWHCVKGFKDR
jgi:hypothetical protein